MSKIYIYNFGEGNADGNASMKNLLGGKGANLAEMSVLNIPVPAGFTITTEACTYFMHTGGKYPNGLVKEVEVALKAISVATGKIFGNTENPLLVSVRSGARMSLPYMMKAVLNIGLTSKTILGLIATSGNERFVWDAYRHLIMIYSDIVLEKSAGIEPELGNGIGELLEVCLLGIANEHAVSAGYHNFGATPRLNNLRGLVEVVGPAEQLGLCDIELDLIHQRDDLLLVGVIGESNLAGIGVVIPHETLHIHRKTIAHAANVLYEIERKLVIVTAGEVNVAGRDALDLADSEITRKASRDNLTMIDIAVGVRYLNLCGFVGGNLRNVDALRPHKLSRFDLGGSKLQLDHYRLTQRSGCDSTIKGSTAESFGPAAVIQDCLINAQMPDKIQIVIAHRLSLAGLKLFRVRNRDT